MSDTGKAGLWSSCQRLFTFLRLADLGYTVDHCRYALQMAVGISIALVFVVVDPVYDALDQRSYWTVVTTAFVLEPTLGSALNKGAQGMVGALIGAALGIGSQAIAEELVGNYNYTENPAPLAVACTACIAVATFFLMLHRLRYAYYAHLWHVSIYTLAIVSAPGIHATAADYVGMAKLLATTAIGVAIAFIVSFTVFPSRALGMLQRLMATSLERLANLSFQVLGALVEDPDEHMRLQGSTGTDSRHQFVDDGLEHKYEDLHASAVSLAADFSRMEELLRAAKAERFLYLRKPAIPVGAYRRSSRAASRLLVQISGLLYSFETGTLRLDLCKRHRTLLEAVRQDTATALTALSGLIFASVSAAYTEEKICDLVGGVIQLQHSMEGANFGAYDAGLETLASVIKVAANVARQVSLLYCELHPEGSQRLHTYAASMLDPHMALRDVEKGAMMQSAQSVQPPPSAFAAYRSSHTSGNGSDSAHAGERQGSQPGLDLSSVSTSIEGLVSEPTNTTLYGTESTASGPQGAGWGISRSTPPALPASAGDTHDHSQRRLRVAHAPELQTVSSGDTAGQADESASSDDDATSAPIYRVGGADTPASSPQGAGVGSGQQPDPSMGTEGDRPFLQPDGAFVHRPQRPARPSLGSFHAADNPFEC